MGRKNKGRKIHGVILLDKPLKISSNHALQRVKRLFDANKAGHTGSLDPLATGMLPICLGEATKVSAFLLDADKTYRFKCRLGQVTATGDAEGDVISERPFEHIQLADIEKYLPELTGDIMQVPPMYSALKIDGQRLYDLARQGIEVERKARPVTIYSLDVISFENGEVELETRCSKGTYVRTLAEDLGEKLGCGAYVTELRRTSVGPYQTGMLTLDQLMDVAEDGFDALDGLLLDLDSGISDWPVVELDPDSAYYMKLGQPVQIARAPTEGLVRVYDGDQFIGIGKIQDDGRVAPKRMMNL
ncbi:MAG: tRNA pseudouridine(55) synthase TruB [endosymbiont of Galathealinum brachiosum]|uniref:tRNA pseudouridine synthase B n=1 Tax=endosymbiont of Galathealinum brachiosum TaxID=2200906 RepID=A0A370DAH2_9GAMM|nr:MAG: tRNA pseudouridine(55) synthase TruB [endosymbiont of Galathealinum brachiosum]